MDQRPTQNRLINGSGVFFLINDGSKTFTILCLNIRKSGAFIEDCGGGLSHDFAFNVNASKEVFEETCGTIMIEPSLLVDEESIIAGSRYKCFIIRIEQNVPQLKDNLTNFYRDNRKTLQDEYNLTKDRKMLCFLETNELIVVNLDELISDIEGKLSKDRNKEAKIFINHNNQKYELHRRCFNVIKEITKQRYLEGNISTYTLQQKFLQKQNCSYVPKLFGRPYFALQKSEGILKLQPKLTPYLDGAGITVLLFDKEKQQIYIVLFVNVKKSGTFIVECGGKKKENQTIKQTALSETFEESCGVFSFDETCISEELSVVCGQRYKSYLCCLPIGNQTSYLQILYKEHRDLLMEEYNKNPRKELKSYLETQHCLIEKIETIEERLKAGNFYLTLNEKLQLPFHERTVQVLQEFSKNKYFYIQHLSDQFKVELKQVSGGYSVLNSTKSLSVQRSTF